MSSHVPQLGDSPVRNQMKWMARHQSPRPYRHRSAQFRQGDRCQVGSEKEHAALNDRLHGGRGVTAGVSAN